MSKPTHTLSWFELPTLDLGRAVRFYQTVLEAKIKEEVFAGVPHGIFERDGDEAVTGALIFEERRKPGHTGTLIYLSVDGRLDACLGRVEAAGGKIVVGKTHIGPQGHIAVIADTEGNHVGLHTRP